MAEVKKEIQYRFAFRQIPDFLCQQFKVISDTHELEAECGNIRKQFKFIAVMLPFEHCLIAFVKRGGKHF